MPLDALSPLDGRYRRATLPLREYFSERALIKYRFFVERNWLVFFLENNIFPHTVPAEEIQELKSLEFSDAIADDVKAIEKETNHDVKAVEYALKKIITNSNFVELAKYTEWIHWGCTSEDINNLSHQLALKSALQNVIIPSLEKVISGFATLARSSAEIPMLSLTHGQPATPTTFGKEMAVFAMRLLRKIRALKNVKIQGKFNGAVGNYNAQLAAGAGPDFPSLAKKFVTSLDLEFNEYSTQIECHDSLCEVLGKIGEINTVLLGAARDFWTYISLNRLQLLRIDGEVGSSTMPHKINPIDFENCEGNIGLANAMLHHLTEKLPVSRMQRDLSDSTVLRNIGVAAGYSLVAWSSLIRGISKVSPDAEKMTRELDDHWEVLTEAVQTVMRKHRLENPYERLKQFSRGEQVTRQSLEQFIDTIAAEIGPEDATRLRSLTPSNYLGAAKQLALNAANEVDSFLQNKN